MPYALKLVTPSGEFLSWLYYSALRAYPSVHSDPRITEEARCINHDPFALNHYKRRLNCEQNPVAEVHVFQSDADIPWQCRENKRFEDGQYKRLPWHTESWFGTCFNYPKDKTELQQLHFAHVSMDDVTKIAFTENDDKGKRDIQTRMKPGRYLSRFYSDVLSEKDIQYWAGIFAAHYDKGELHLATTREDIRWVYENGPNSCMSHDISDYCTGGIHPCEVYAAGDLAIAYLKSENRVTARAVVWPDKKIHSTIYGDYHRLNSLLEATGYWRSDCDDWFGARLLRIEAPNGGYVAPYVDFHREFDVEGNYLVCTDCGCYELSQTNGTTRDGVTCFHCEDSVDEDDCYYINDEFVCDCCRDRYYFYCDDCGAWHHERDSSSIETARGRIICDDCYSDDYTYCEECEEVVRNYETRETIEHQCVCDDCAEYLNTTPCGELTTNDEPLTVCDCRECDRERDRITEEEGDAPSLPQTGRIDDPCQQSLI